MGERAKLLLNEYSAKGLLYREELNLDNFYTADLKLMIEVARKEIERLNNIINELEKYCKEEIEEGNNALEQLSMLYNSSETESYIKGQQAKCNHILDKLQELTGEDK